MVNKKGQAALEFLTTYGWAFLVILVMIGALAYFGVLDPSRFVSQRCQFGAPLVCDGENYKLTTTTMNVRLKNTLNEQYFINDVLVKTTDAAFTSCVAAGTSFTPQTVPVDGYTEIVCELPAAVTAGIAEGKKTRVQVQVDYNQGAAANAAYSKIVAGEVYANAQAP